ncbi:MAG: hypothetical protein ACJKTH_02515 [Patescibacteria group bacterium UBA2163]
MDTLLKQLTSYNLFNYLLPGVLFAVFMEFFTPYSFADLHPIITALIYYFTGMVISRIGSLIVEPFLKWIKFVKFADHKDFVIASLKNSKIEVLSEANNTYRTLTALFLVMLLIKLYESLASVFSVLSNGTVLPLLLLFGVFLFSYRKQTEYITSTIEATKV